MKIVLLSWYTSLDAYLFISKRIQFKSIVILRYLHIYLYLSQVDASYKENACGAFDYRLWLRARSLSYSRQRQTRAVALVRLV